MRKVWNTLVVLCILLGMIMSMGVAADAAEADAAIFAVSGTALAPEVIDMMKTQSPDCLIVDVDGLAEGQSAAGYTVAYTASEPTQATEYEAVWPGVAKSFDVGAQDRKVVLVGLDETTGSDVVAGAISSYAADDPYVIAIGPAAAAAAVSLCAEVDMFLTVGLDDAAAGTATVVNVGKQAEAPVSLVKVNADGTASAEAIPVPQPVADPNVQPEQSSEGDEAAGNGVDDMLGAGPVIDVPSEDAPETTIYYAVTYDGNGRDEGTFVPDDMQVPNNEPYTLRENGYTREGYEFAGWTLDVPDAEQVYQPGDEITVNANITVYAKWAPVAAAPEGEPAGTEPVASGPSYTVTYKPGVGAGSEQAYSFVGEASKDITLNDGRIFTAPEGMQFSGWQVDSTGEILGGGAAYTLTNDVSFTAQYAALAASFTVTYDFGESATVGYADTVNEGDVYYLPAENVAEPPAGKVFGGWLVNGELKAAGEQYPVTADLIVAAQWDDQPAQDDPSTVEASEYTITYKSGVEGIEDHVEKVAANGSFELPDNPFAYTDGRSFLGWREIAADGTVLAGADTPLAPKTVIEAAQSDRTYIAVTEPKAATVYTLTYVPGDGSATTYVDTTAKPNENGEYALLAQLPEGWTTPAGKTFGGWEDKAGNHTYTAGQAVVLTADTTFTAIFNDVVKEKVDPAAAADNLTYTKGSTDQLQVNFKVKVNVETVSVDGTPLTLNSQYGVTDADPNAVAFVNAYLDGLAVGDHTVSITFTATETVEYTPYARTLTIKEEAKEVTEIAQDWDRSQNKIVDFSKYNRGNPTKVELLRAYEKDANGNYKKDENGYYIPIWADLTKDKDYTINGTSVTFYPSLLGTWKNQEYGFRVTFDGSGTDKGVNTMRVNLKVSGTVPTTQPSTTNAPTGSSGYVTGDSVNLRAGAGTNTQVLRTVAKGTKIIIYSVSNGWAYVSVDGVTGYMSANYIAYDSATPTATPTGAVSPATGDNNNVVLYIVILVVLIIALAAVLIIVMKRRKN